MNIYRAISKPLKRLYRRFVIPKKRQVNDWVGNYSSQAEAQAHCDGYDSKIIFDKVYSAARKVKDGEVAYERDSVVFDSVQHNWPLLSCLLHAALQKEKSSLRVLDFGGALGTAYFAVRKFIPAEVDITWIIVEQPHFVKAGKEEFENSELSFAYNLASVFNEEEIHVVLLSGIIQYLEAPKSILTELLKYKFDYLLLDRTFFINQDEHRIVVQKVPESIYLASYPCWLFNEEKFLQDIVTDYSLITDFKSQFDSDSILEDNKTIYHKGFYFRRHG